MRNLKSNLKDSDIKNNSIFGLKRKPINSTYNGIAESRRYIGRPSIYVRTDVRDLSSFLNSSDLDPYFKNPGTKLKECTILSNTLYSTNRIYQQLIDYLVDMFYWRTVTTPRRIKKLDSGNYDKETYMKIYHRMIEIVDGFNIETNYPKILAELFKEGRVFLYAMGDSASKSVSTIILPSEYCQPSVETQHGTTQVMFNFNFFNTIASGEKERNLIFDLFPEEFKELYKVSIEEGNSWQSLNPKFSTCLTLNRIGFPTFLSIFYDIIDYKTYKMNELDRNTNGLERLVTQEIDLEKTGLELPEVEELHQSIANIIDGNGTTTITSVGKLDVKQIQEELSKENKALSYAYKGIFDNAGFNYEIFAGDSERSVTLSNQRDQNFVWRFVEQLVSFYNLAVNNIYNFGDYQLSFRVLPISPYDEKEKLEIYRSNATLGVGLVDLVVASGIKQVDIESTLELEENLDLVKRLMPLQSSHVQSTGSSQSSTTIESAEETSSEEEQDKNNLGTKKLNKVKGSDKE